MIKNLWSKIELYCINHDEPVPMYVYSGSVTPFYACPKYMKKDEAHPNGHEEYERGCANRISFDLVQRLVEQLDKRMSADMANGEIVNYKGLKLHWKTVDATIIEYTDNKIKLGIINKKEIGTWHS